jgi:hypothetical protein
LDSTEHVPGPLRPGEADRDRSDRFIDHPEIAPLAIKDLTRVASHLRYEKVRVETEDDAW